MLLLLRACHPGPTVAVTLLAALVAAGVGHSAAPLVLVVLAVFAGQLSIGWSNDLLDADRDRQVHRADKPIASGDLSTRAVGVALALALAACVLFSLLSGLWAGLVHLVLVVGSGWAYNARLKSTAWSWLPYAVAFGSLPAVVTLALDPPVPPAPWMMLVGALLGVGAHLVNVLPDLDDDAATGVRGLPHRLGRSTTQTLATILLSVASVVVVVGADGPPPAWAWVALASVVALAAVGMRGRGRISFHAAVAIALIDVVMFTIRA
ncbi:MAG TPA: UbiA family prenyltransferase [Nocardioidaceae bacterium]|nr:UbiA family prenyltransferase [Nocardioidaceae bacterium]